MQNVILYKLLACIAFFLLAN